VTCAEVIGINMICLHFMQYWGDWLIAFWFSYSLGYTVWKVLRFYPRTEESVTFLGDNVYCDFGHTAFAWAAIVCLAQCIMTKFVANAALKCVDDGEENMSYLYWFTAFIAVQVSFLCGPGADSNVGSGLKSPVWAWLIKNAGEQNLTLSYTDDLTKEAEVMYPRPEVVWMRFLMSFLTNGLVRHTIAYITPILLMGSSDDLEFVQNALAVAFIPMLDDKDGAVVYKATLGLANTLKSQKSLEDTVKDLQAKVDELTTRLDSM